MPQPRVNVGSARLERAVVIRVFDDKPALGAAAAADAAVALRGAIAANGEARIVAATGASQFTFLEALTKAPQLDWKRVELFHLDEYIGLPISHPASFRRYLQERLIAPAGITRHHLLDGEAEPREVCARVGGLLKAKPVDAAFVGIGENAHLAFNDPPADFEAEEPYLVVDLDEACRRQQVGEGWFQSLTQVPRQAISMSIRQILRARKILCIVPERRKAEAVKACLEGPITNLAPASILRTHADVTLYLDRESASLLGEATLRSSAAAPA
jgi:glucosamine-6-phosphate deaminase